MAKQNKGITASSTAEYFSKNLQQVGFSSQTKAVLTTLKEAVDNSLDACDDNNMLPEISVVIDKKGAGSLRNSDKILVRVSDNGPGIDVDDIPKVFGEYLASSKFGRGRCSRGQQGIGISAATTWAQMTNASGAKVITKTKKMRKAVRCDVEVDIKQNRGLLKKKETFDWDRPHGTSVEFVFDGRLQFNGEGGILTYLMGNVLVNPHLTLEYQFPEQKKVVIKRVSDDIPTIPQATEPHPHTMKLGEFIAHSHLFGRVKTSQWLKKGFSRVSDKVIAEIKKNPKCPSKIMDQFVDQIKHEDFKTLYTVIQKTDLMAPSTSSVLRIGEEGLAKSIKRLGEIDFFSVISRRPTICDFKPVQIEVAIARFQEKVIDDDAPVQLLRFANRVPLQFDKAGCAIYHAITSVNWKSYGIAQPKGSLPLGNYVLAVSVVSPFIKFKNASKETIDASEELVEEIRRALMQAGQKLSRHIKRESKAEELEQKIRHIEQFGPILVEGLVRITKASQSRKKKAEEGLRKILGRDAKETEEQLTAAQAKLEAQKKKESVSPKGNAASDPSESGKKAKGKTKRGTKRKTASKAKSSVKKNAKKSKKKVSNARSSKVAKRSRAVDAAL